MTESKIIYIATDMEGLAGVDRWEQCYDPADDSPDYLDGREHLTADANAAIAGCFAAGAAQVRLIDGHGRNRNRGFIEEKLDPRASRVWIAQRNPTRLEGLDAQVTALAIIGQHAMAGTVNGFLDHTQQPKHICRFRINGIEQGEIGQLALAAGGRSVPLVYVSGDEACCKEARRLFAHVATTPTKRGTGWATCRLYDPQTVRRDIRTDIANAVRSADRANAWRVRPPIEIEVEYAWSEWADRLAKVPGVQRTHARIVKWVIDDPADIFTWPSENWHPPGR